jgi:uncharacterized protein YceH (UPF0502 family)
VKSSETSVKGMVKLDSVEARVLGCLMEKEAATPEYYPLSLNALTNACNQKTNRDPVVSYADATVDDALERLRALGLTLRITGREVRVPKHAHRMTEAFNLGRRESAVLCVLLLRGPQTAGELRQRTASMYAFDDLEGVESTLNRMAAWQPEPLVKRLERRPGFKEPRHAHLLSGDVEEAEAPSPATAEPRRDRMAELEARVEALERAFAEFRQQFE